MTILNRRVSKRWVIIGVLMLMATLAVPVAAVAQRHRPPPNQADLTMADYILGNGKISILAPGLDPATDHVDAIAIRDGEVVAYGSDRFVRRFKGHGTQTVDLDGRRVLPGLIDGHIHGMRNAYHCFTQTVRLDLVTTRADALAAYAAKADDLDDGRWIWTTFGGWNLNQLDTPEIFTFDELTAAAPSNPVWVTGAGFSGPIVNQAALDAIGIGPGDPGVVLDGDGNPTGQLTQPASGMSNEAILTQLNALTREDRAGCLADFMAEVNRRGMTAWKDAGGNQAPWAGTGEIGREMRVREPTMALYQAGGFTTRIAYHDMADYGGYEQVVQDTRTSLGGLGDDLFRYLGPGEDTMATDDDYADFTRYSAEKRLSVETHVGNHDAILDGFEAADQVYPISELNWAIAHPSNGEPTDEQLVRASALDIGYNLTFSSVRNGATGPRFRSTMEAGVRFCLASDAMNVAPYAPFQNLWYVTTGDTLIPGVGGVPEEERLTRTEALRHATVDCAWGIDQDGRYGTLEVGTHGDLIVLSDDYFTVEDDEVKDLYSVLTMVDGHIVHAEGEYAGLED